MEQGAINFDNPHNLDAEERRVFSCLKEGKENAVKASILCLMTGFRDVHVRSLIRTMVMKRDCLIGSCSEGFFIPIRQEEIVEACSGLRSRGLKILARAAVLQRVSLRMVFDQAVLEAEKEKENEKC
jgi:hypothetical protein